MIWSVLSVKQLPHLKHTFSVAPSFNAVEAVHVPASFAVFTSMTDIPGRFKTSTLANLVVLDPFANLDNNTSTLMARAFDPVLRHLVIPPIIHHIVDITEAEAGGIQFDEDIIRTFKR